MSAVPQLSSVSKKTSHTSVFQSLGPYAAHCFPRHLNLSVFDVEV
jgi:hypothetical protein